MVKMSKKINFENLDGVSKGFLILGIIGFWIGVSCLLVIIIFSDGISDKNITERINTLEDKVYYLENKDMVEVNFIGEPYDCFECPITSNHKYRCQDTKEVGVICV